MLSRRTLFAGAVGVAVAEMIGARKVSAQDGYVGAIYASCAVYGCDPEFLIGVVDCETAGTWNPDIIGPNGERGLAQIHPSGHYSYAWGWSGEAQIELLAQEVAAGNGCRWACIAGPGLCG